MFAFLAALVFSCSIVYSVLRSFSCSVFSCRIEDQISLCVSACKLVSFYSAAVNSLCAAWFFIFLQFICPGIDVCLICMHICSQSSKHLLQIWNEYICLLFSLLWSFQVMRPCGKLWARCAHLRAANRHGWLILSSASGLDATEREKLQLIL